MRSSIFASVLVAAAVLTAQACSGTHTPNQFDDRDGSAASGDSATGGPREAGDFLGDGSLADAGRGPCVGVACNRHECSGGATTTISGKVYDPAGKNPLYNVVVYVPNSKPAALPTGASCDSCDSLYSGDPIAVAVTDETGSFTLENAPDGANVPLVIQIGKWRRQLTVPTVTMCTDNPQPDKSLTLPKNHTDPGNDIPNIAISTGGADTLECLLRRVGVDVAEYMGGAGTQGRIHIFQGLGGQNTALPGPASSAGLWGSQTDLMNYDIVLLSCEGAETSNMNQQALHDYASAGGRVFASHYHYAWLNSGPYASENLGMWTPDGPGPAMDPITGSVQQTLASGQAFPKGVSLQKWLGNVNALTSGHLQIYAPRYDVTVSATNTPSQPWIQADSPAAGTQYFSFNTPTNAPLDDAGVPTYCGRVVYSDLHVAGNSHDLRGMKVPVECANADLSAQEKALEFMLFDLSSCVSPDDKPPAPPPQPK